MDDMEEKMKQKNSWLTYKASDRKELEKLCRGYRAFLDAGKTERECTDQALSLIHI